MLKEEYLNISYVREDFKINMAFNKIGVIEYHDEKYIKEVMKIVERKIDSEISFLEIKEYDFSELDQFSVIYDMISPFNKYLTEIMKIYYLNGTYIINNPFVISHYNKILQTYKLIDMKMPIPKTMILPNEPDQSEKDFVGKPYFKVIFKKFNLPFIIKPYDGFANSDVFVINSHRDLYHVYKEKKAKIMLVQEAIFPVDYYRVFVANKKNVCFLKRKPRFIEAENYDFYDFSLLTPELKNYIEKKSIHICKEMGYDLSTIEWSITKDKKAFIIDVNDAPNIADPRKAKKANLHFPEETYSWLVDKIANMIIEKSKINPRKRDVVMSPNFAITLKNLVSGLKYSF